MLCFHAFLIVEATSITFAKPSLIIGLLEAIKVVTAMRRAHPHALSGGCRQSLAGDSGIIAAVLDDAGASSSMPREEASVKHSQLTFWCRYIGGEPTHRVMEASEGRLTASPVLHGPWPATSPSIDQDGSNHTLGPLAAPSLTQAWCVLTRSGQSRGGVLSGSDFVHSLDTPSWVRVEGRLVRYSERQSMDQQVVTVDQFTAAMASIQEALASLRQEIGGQQGRPPAVAQDETPHDSLPPPPPPPIPSAPQASPYVLHGHSEIAPPAVVQTTVADDAHARMDHLEQCVRQMRVSDGSVVWDDFEGMPAASLPAKFRMPDIERYTGIGCPRLYLRLYSTVMRAHGLDESQMITLFLLSLSGAAQRWFASLESSRRRTWGDLAREFLRQFSFNTVVDVSRRELEALR
ncbi:hypothetical protein VitviT2T_005095 [Vitis vinifera]|uniref:Retrotransposon gag domain-containing protein n=1 Tax=Vitis vinifera TaxID=29760 RepID=A0ABY9BSV3_VITVI|nr:hypothetical protein VitviT2T_005095 [Vitis vinifera]